MSLTSQLSDKNSSVCQFFAKYESKEGVNKCLSFLQSSREIRLPSLVPQSFVTWRFIGTTTDYLIRYAANQNCLIFKKTIAYEALQLSKDMDEKHYGFCKNLYKIGKRFLNGRSASDPEAVYSATALAMLDNVYRSRGKLPKLFYERITKSKKEKIDSVPGKTPEEKKTRFLFNEYYEKELGGKLYTQDISEMVKTFAHAMKDKTGDLFGAKFVVFNYVLAKSLLVGGADFDCVIRQKNHLILTDIKTTKNPLKIEHLRQIIGYALLYDPRLDDFSCDITDIGIYHSRSGSFRFLPLEDVIKMTLAGLLKPSVSRARKTFVEEIQNAEIALLSPEEQEFEAARARAHGLDSISEFYHDLRRIRGW